MRWIIGWFLSHLFYLVQVKWMSMLNNWQEQGWDFCVTGTWVLCISTTSWNMFCKPVTSVARVYFVSEGETNALTVGMTVSSWCEQSTWFPNPAVFCPRCCLDLPKTFPFYAVILILPRSKTQYVSARLGTLCVKKCVRVLLLLDKAKPEQ